MPFLLILEWANLPKAFWDGRCLEVAVEPRGLGEHLINFQPHLNSFLIPRNKSHHVFLSSSPRNVGSYWNAQEEPHLDCRGSQPASEFLTEILHPKTASLVSWAGRTVSLSAPFCQGVWGLKILLTCFTKG